MSQLLKIYSLIIMMGLLIVMLFVTIPWDEFTTKDPAIIATFAFNGILWGGLLFYELTKRAYSLLIIHWLFCFLFFFAIAFMQYMYGYFPWIGTRNGNIILQTNLLLLGWTLFVWIGYKLAQTDKPSAVTTNTSFQIPPKLLLILIGCSVLITIYRVSTGASVFFEQNAHQGLYEEYSSSLKLLQEHTLQAISFFAAVLAIFRYKQQRTGLLYVFIAVGGLLISYFPGGMSRYAVAVVYGALLLTIFDSLRTNRLFILALLIGFLVVFPFLNAFRNTSFNDVDISTSFLRTLQQLPDIWKEGDYDAYSMLTLVLDYIKNYGITWGKQLLGVFFFWVPRALWAAKPIGTGAFVSTQLGWLFTNLSAPLPAEAIINVGRIGMLFWASGVGWLIAKLDGLYWNNIEKTQSIRQPFELLYPVLIMFFFFMNRGDLLSSTAYMMAYIAVWWVLCKCCKRKAP